MPNTVLGKVTCTPRGAYSASTAYEVLDIVSYMGGSYMALKSVQGVTPSNDGTNWMMLAAKGDTGDTGSQGIAAGFGTPIVNVDDTTGTPSANIETSGPDTAKVFTFNFSGLKGETGAQGPQGVKGDPGTDVESISRTSGTGAPGSTDTYTMYASDGSTIGTFTVYNGANGTGTGDLMADGSVPMTGNLQMGGNRITNVGAPTAATDAVRQSDLEAVSNEVDGIISGETPITLPAATEAKIGGVIIGNGLSVTEDGTISADDQLPTGGSAGQVLTKTSNGEAWQNVPSELPSGGTDGQILTKTAGGVEWDDPPDTGVTTFNGRTGAVTPQSGDYTAAQVGAVPTSRTVNGKALSSNITLTADDVGATVSQSGTYTLTTAGWTQSGSIYQQVINAAFVQADSACVFVDPVLTTDKAANDTILEAWALVANMGMAQGNGTVTLYASEVPGVNIPVNVGVA